MSKLEKALYILDEVEINNSIGAIRYDPRAVVLVTLIYIAFIVSIPVGRIDILIWFALFPIIEAPLFGLQFSRIFLQSQIVLPLVLLIGIFNPFFDREYAFSIGSVAISEGWVTFIGIILRGLFCMQALLILIRSMGFIGMVRGLEKLGLPKFLTSLVLMIFRYMKVLLEEGLSMSRARASRSYGRSKLSIKMWGILIGQLFIRSVDRAERVSRAMMARGFNGTIPSYITAGSRWTVADTVFLTVWVLIFALLRIFNISILFNGLQ